MRKIIYSLSLLVIILFQTANATTIATINLDEVVKNSTAMTKANKTLENRKLKVEKELKVEEKALSDEKTTLESQVKTLSQEVAQEKILAFQQKVLEFQKKVKEKEAELQKTYMNVVIEITNNVKEIVAEMKQEKEYNFDVVMPVATLVYTSSDLDISSEVLKRLNKKLKEVATLK